ncbi:MAG: response regulator transcription factor [Chloroflexi bacterium]|nr:MAG: response regulator transcription factor [Chloroflexota bacterium]TMF38358.1 MAG: response regulator transcription factor [Chloroflexota bacterium]
MFREGLRRVLERTPDLTVLWDTGTVAELMAYMETSPVDVVLLDLYLGPDDDSLAAARAARERFADVRVIVVSASLDWDSVTASRQAGASGYLPKDLAVEDMVAAIRALADPNLGRMSFSDRVDTSRPNNGVGLVSRAGLTRREREVLFEMVGGHSNRDIAASLGVSVTTVNKHVHHILSKLKAKTRAQVIARMRSGPSPRPYTTSAGRG